MSRQGKAKAESGDPLGDLLSAINAGADPGYVFVHPAALVEVLDEEVNAEIEAIAVWLEQAEGPVNDCLELDDWEQTKRNLAAAVRRGVRR